MICSNAETTSMRSFDCSKYKWAKIMRELFLTAISQKKRSFYRRKFTISAPKASNSWFATHSNRKATTYNSISEWKIEHIYSKRLHSRKSAKKFRLPEILLRLQWNSIIYFIIFLASFSHLNNVENGNCFSEQPSNNFVSEYRAKNNSRADSFSRLISMQLAIIWLLCSR